HGAASTYHQLGIITQKQRDFAAAEAWYKKSLAIFEKQGNEHGAAITYHQLGRIAEERRDFPQAADFYLRSAKMFSETNDTHNLRFAIRSYARLLHTTAGTEHSQLRQAWSTCAPQELTKILEEMEVELNDDNS
ncbi:MAG: tetratricopeptide repeat protein, partial [Lachnospiraceae bacterium]|nr:tetratricopeptide repeat protein [Lachnospiraceae bacterium]